LIKYETTCASAPGKIIIAGEHFVVHGSAAVAAAIDKRVRVSVSKGSREGVEFRTRSKNMLLDKESWRARYPAVSEVVRQVVHIANMKDANICLTVESELPDGSGLGSSAAVCVATAASLGRFLGLELGKGEIAKIAALGEKRVHGNPSGVDVETCLRGGIISFSKKSGSRPLRSGADLEILVVFSGQRRRTSKLVELVDRLRRAYPATFEQLAAATSLICDQVEEAIEANDLVQLGSLMNLLQTSLSWIGVTTKSLDALLERVRKDKVLGAKITGAGGGGSIIAVPDRGKSGEVLRRVSSYAQESFVANLPQEGLRWESELPE
jgi:mevalonate kinase